MPNDNESWEETITRQWKEAIERMNKESGGEGYPAEGLISKPWEIDDCGDYECDHKYKQYHGLTESYEYCEYCDDKRKPR